jgi:hypothetical protein
VRHVFEHDRDVDPTVVRPIRVEPALGFLELAIAAGSVSPACLIPRDRHVDQALEEVAFGRGRVTPFILELLVRLEVRSGANQLDAPLESHAGDYPRPPGGGSVGRVATILLVGVDLFFRGKLEGLLPDHRLVTSDSVAAPDLVIADIARVEPDEVVDAWPDIPILGYTNHTDKSGLQRGHTAGFDQVIVKSALVERASELVDELTGK